MFGVIGFVTVTGVSTLAWWFAAAESAQSVDDSLVERIEPIGALAQRAVADADQIADELAEARARGETPITATDDFAGSPFYSYYLSNSIDGQIRAVLFDGVMTSYPFAVWGARFLYAPSDDFRIKIGAYQLTENMWDPDKHGTDFAFRDSDGLSLMTQLEWDWSLGGKPGHFNLGMNNVSFDMPNFNFNTFLIHMGGIVLVIVLAILLPIFDLNQLVQ